ncbi:MAG: flagellar protein FlaG [Lachnospiraceae bacterium]|nr:flagellar protein FlaG [Lachnospiraceae bacterium]MCR5409776.1 flagellar protein FlaG [Lachnospiraceae bacterium]
MSIEPISTGMTYQAINTPQVKPVEQTAADLAEKTVISEQQQAVEPKIQETQSAAEEGSGSGQGQNQNLAGEQAQKNLEVQNEKIKNAVEELNKKIESHSEAVFGIHEKTNRVTIKIVDKDTKKVIKELPPEKTLDMIAKVWEMAGILVDEKK